MWNYKRVNRKPTAKPKKAKPKIEITNICDNCGKQLLVHHSRLPRSIICAPCTGCYGDEIDGKVYFFCSKDCREIFRQVS